MADAKDQRKHYDRTAAEWELLADIALRLHHPEEAKEAYKRCVEAKFSPKAWDKLLEMFTDEDNLPEALAAAVRLTIYAHRFYQEGPYPTTIARHLFKLLDRHGLSKIHFSLTALDLSEPLLADLQKYLDFARTFDLEGSDF